MVPGITYIFVKKYMEKCLKNILEMKELIGMLEHIGLS